MQKINEQVLKKRIEETVNADMTAGRVGGVAIAVMQEGNTIYQNCFSNEKLGICVNDKTLFRLASMTKPITAVAVLMLIERGLLTLDTHIASILPEFNEMQIAQIKEGEMVNVAKASTPITIRHLLSHGSGIGSGTVGDFVRDAMPAQERTSLKKVVDYYAQNPLDFEPGTRQFYSGIHGFDVLARIVEILTNTSFAEFLKEYLFEPLGMEDTTFMPTAEQWERMVPLHNYVDGAGVLAYFPENTMFGGIPISCCAGGAGLASTISDYKKFAGMLLNKGKVNGRQLISEELICEMATPQLPKTKLGGPAFWGLGVRVVADETYRDLPAGAYGWSGACGTHFWVDPENQIVAIYLKNSIYDGGAGAQTARQFEKDVAAALYER